jgi:hypothetical protein
MSSDVSKGFAEPWHLLQGVCQMYLIYVLLIMRVCITVTAGADSTPSLPPNHSLIVSRGLSTRAQAEDFSLDSLKANQCRLNSRTSGSLRRLGARQCHRHPPEPSIVQRNRAAGSSGRQAPLQQSGQHFRRFRPSPRGREVGFRSTTLPCHVESSTRYT